MEVNFTQFHLVCTPGSLLQHVSGRSVNTLDPVETDSFKHAMNNMGHMNKAYSIYL